MTRLLLIFILFTQIGCSIVQTAIGTFVGTLTSDVVRDELLDKDDDEAPGVGIDSDDNIYILKP